MKKYNALLKAAAILIFLLAVQTMPLLADNYSPGVVMTNEEVLLEGKILFNPQTPGFVSIRQFGGKVSTFTAAQLKHFQVKGKNKYVSRVITYKKREQAVFLEQMVTGEINFLYLRHSPDRYFMELESEGLIEIDKENIVEQINLRATWCPLLMEQLSDSKLHHKRLERVFSDINNKKCRNVPFYALGIIAGGASVSHGIVKEAFNNDFPLSKTITKQIPSAGLFIEAPLWNIPNTYIRYSALFNHHSFRSYYYYIPERMTEVNIKRTDVVIEILPNYQLNSPKLRPYIMAGPALAANLSNKSKMLDKRATETGIDTETKKIRLNLLSPGFSIAAGMKYYYLPHNYIAVEIKSSRIFYLNGHQSDAWQVSITGNFISY